MEDDDPLATNLQVIQLNSKISTVKLDSGFEAFKHSTIRKLLNNISNIPSEQISILIIKHIIKQSGKGEFYINVVSGSTQHKFRKISN